MRYPVPKTGRPSRALGVRLPLLPPHGGMAELERQRAANAQAATTARRFESCCLRLSRSGVVELGRRAVVTREIAGSIPAAGAFHALVVEAGDDAGHSTRRLRVRVPPRVLVVDDDVLVDLAVSGRLRATVVIWLWGSWPPRRPWKPEIAGSTPASQTAR